MRSITAVSRLTGIGPHTLRAWERRYGAVTPTRNSNGQRQYSPEDVRRLRLLASAVDHGHAIGTIAALSDDELQDLIGEEAAPALIKQAEELKRLLLAALKEFRFTECENILKLAVVSLSPADFLERFLGPAMHAVGEHWAHSRLSVVQEHALSMRIQGLLHKQYQRFQRTAIGPVVVFSTPEEERHELGVFGAAWLAGVHGIRSVYLGPALPPGEIALAAKRLSAAAVALGVAPAGDVDRPGMVQALRELLPDHVEIWLGGSGVKREWKSRLAANCRVIGSLREYQQRLELLHPRRVSR